MRAKVKSAGLVILKTEGCAATTLTRPPAARTALDSSVTSGCFSSAFKSASPAKACGVAMRQRCSREMSSVMTTAASVRLTVSDTGTASTAPAKGPCLRISVLALSMSSVTSSGSTRGLAASCTRTSASFSVSVPIALSVFKTVSLRVAPPVRKSSALPRSRSAA